MATDTAIANLRHLYAQMIGGAILDEAGMRRAAQGLLAPAIEQLEQGRPRGEILRFAAGSALGAGLARARDPVTSHAAGVAIAEVQDHLFDQIHSWLSLRGDEGGTSFEIADGTGIERVTISPRLKPMEKLGLVRRTDERRVGPSGRHSIVWVALKKF